MKNIILTTLVIIALQSSAQWQTMGTMPLQDSSNYTVRHTNGFFALPNVFLLPVSVSQIGDSITQYRIYSTNNFGVNWQLITTGYYDFGPIVRSNATTLIAGSRYISYNNGVTWDTLHTDSFAPSNRLICFDSICFAKNLSTDYRLFKSTDYCKTWTQINDSITVSPKGFQAIDANTIIRVRNGSSLLCRFFISENSGNSWLCRTNVPIYSNVYFDFINRNIGYLQTYSRLYKTTDAGITWDSIHTSPAAHLSRFMFHNENLGFTNGDLIRKTIDGGKTWIDQDVLPSPISVVNCINDTVCWTIAGTTSKIYYTTNQGGAPILLPPTNSLNENKKSVLTGFSLYPNPTDNGNFQIRWNAEHTGMAAVSVFDIYGRLVHQTSLQVTQTGTQDFDVQMNAKTGMYIIRVEQDGKVATKSFLVK
jgi:hypothetical protein